MNLHEYQAKKIFIKYNLPVPKGYICKNFNDIKKNIKKIKNNKKYLILKCQIHAGNRGQSGGIKITNSIKKMIKFSKKWLGKRLITCQTNKYGQIVNKILIEEVKKIKKELYLSIIIDRNKNSIVFLCSNSGGVNIEKVSEKTPNLIYKILIDPLIGPQIYQIRKLSYKIGLSENLIIELYKIFKNSFNLFKEKNLTLLEINPLAITDDNKLICLDAKLNIDDNSLYKHPELLKMRDLSQENKKEYYASKWNLNYVSLEGNIGCMVNGAGLAMSTMDIIKLNGGNPANFLDIGGGATQERVSKALKLILSNKKINAVLINIFGGIVRCDLIAKGIINSIIKLNINLPIVIRLEGNNAIKGINYINNSNIKNIITSKSLIKAIKKIIILSRNSKCQF